MKALSKLFDLLEKANPVLFKQDGNVFTSADSGIFTPTAGGDLKRKKPYYSALAETSLKQLENWLEKQQKGKVGYHEHDGFPLHPVRVVHHQEYFSATTKDKSVDISSLARRMKRNAIGTSYAYRNLADWEEKLKTMSPIDLKELIQAVGEFEQKFPAMKPYPKNITRGMREQATQVGREAFPTAPKAYEGHLRNLGHNLDTIKEMGKLLDTHGYGGQPQDYADRRLVKEIRDKTSLGLALLDLSKFESFLFDAWVHGFDGRKEKAVREFDFEWKRDPQYMRSSMGLDREATRDDVLGMFLYGRGLESPPKLYRRKGKSPDKIVEAWTLREEGASTGQVLMEPDISMTIDDMNNAGYVVLAGVSKITGAPGEMEITLLNKKRLNDKSIEKKAPPFPKRDAVLENLGPHRILEEHDDGDLTVESEGKKYVVTTNGDVFEEVDVEEGTNALQKSDLPISTKAIITNKDGKVLCLKDRWTKFYDLPGGHIASSDETPIEGLIREIKEETGLTVDDVEELDLSGDVKIGSDNHPVLFYRVAASGTLRVDPEEHTKYVWVGEDNLDDFNLGAFKDVVEDEVQKDDLPLRKYDYSELEVGPATFYVQYALSPFEIQRGLSFRESLEPNQGMLFVFSRSGSKTFHTLNMLFPLDMICVDENPDGLNVITHIEENVEPDKLIVHLPSCKYVLEIGAGESDKRGLAVGDRVKGIKEYNTDIQKLQPPREGLVPKTGSYEHPGRWIRPEKPKEKFESLVFETTKKFDKLTKIEHTSLTVGDLTISFRNDPKAMQTLDEYNLARGSSTSLNEFIAGVLNSWNSSVENNKSAALSEVVRERFDLKDTKESYAVKSKLFQIEYPGLKPILEKMADLIYEGTQAELSERGIEEVTLYRGVRLDHELDGIHSFKSRPLSSFTTDYAVAKRFGNCIVTLNVPRKRVFSMNYTGIGSSPEGEVVILGGTDSAYFVSDGGISEDALQERAKKLGLTKALEIIEEDDENADWIRGLDQTDIQKLQPPREGLVPKSGDWEHPDRWVLPEKGEQDKTAKAKHLIALFDMKIAPQIKTPSEMGGAISKLFREIMDLGFTLEQASEIIDPKGAEAIREARKREAEREKEKAAWHTLSLDDLLEKKEEELVRRAENWGNQMYGDWERGLIQGQIDGLEDYLNRGYKDINKALRQGQVPWQVRALDAALAKAVVREPITVYRGIADQALGDVLPGGEFIDKAFVSTSLLPQVAMRAGELGGRATPVLYEMSLPKGIHAAFVSGLLPEAKEAEILIQRGQRFRVMGVNKKRLVDEDRETTREYVVVSVEAIT